MPAKCVQSGRVLGKFIDAGAELDDDDPAVAAAPERFETVEKPKPAKKSSAKKSAAKKK